MTGGNMSTVLSFEQAQQILDTYHGQTVPIASLQELEIHGYSAFAPTKSYKVHLEDGVSYIVKVTHPAESNNPVYTPNTLSTEYELLFLLSKHTDVPHPTAHKLDTSLSLVPFPYLLLSAPRGVPLSRARTNGMLTPRQSLLLDMRIGTYLRQTHDRVQNDWFGLPTQAADELYSWQEAFTYLLEGLLHEAQELGVALPYESVRQYLSRAIGFFLFDDCEVPSLVSLSGDDEAIWVDLHPDTPIKDDEEVSITSLMALSHALWGDPLLEAMFIAPSRAFLEGYGGSPIVFARQKTKRLWYTFFLALAVLVQSMKGDDSSYKEASDRGEKIKWAKEALVSSVEKLKDAPCY